MSKTFRELSKTKWTAEVKDTKSIQLDYDYMKKSRDYYRVQYYLAEKRIAAYKGHITRLKNKLKK